MCYLHQKYLQFNHGLHADFVILQVLDMQNSMVSYTVINL